MVHTLAVVRARLVHGLLAYFTFGELCIGREPRVRQQKVAYERPALVL